jgi:endonuclease YncB( thermonuclease family)
MASAGRIVAILGATVLAAVAGAGGAFVWMKAPPSPPAEPKPVAAAAPASSKPEPAALPPPASTSESAPDVATTEFVHGDADFTIVRPTAAFISASPDAPKMYDLPAGLGVRATEHSKDGKWQVALTEDGQAAYLPSADLGPYQPDAAKQVASLADTISGPARVIDTATLSVNGQTVPLFGILGETGAPADQMQALINGNGSQVTCQLQVETYKCLAGQQLDVARIALFNGAAKPGPDATEDYKQQAAAAEAAHKGVWQ